MDSPIICVISKLCAVSSTTTSVKNRSKIHARIHNTTINNVHISALIDGGEIYDVLGQEFLLSLERVLTDKYESFIKLLPRSLVLIENEVLCDASEVFLKKYLKPKTVQDHFYWVKITIKPRRICKSTIKLS